jgi:hypothetical protein
MLTLKPSVIGKLCRAGSLMRLQPEHAIQEGVQLIQLNIIHYLREKPFQSVRQRRPLLNVENEFTCRGSAQGQKRSKKGITVFKKVTTVLPPLDHVLWEVTKDNGHDCYM